VKFEAVCSEVVIGNRVKEATKGNNCFFLDTYFLISEGQKKIDRTKF